MSDTIASGVFTSPLDLDMNLFSFKLNAEVKDYYKVLNEDFSALAENGNSSYQNLLNIILDFINKAIENSFNLINDVLSAVFDTIVEILIKNSKFVDKDPFIPFRILYIFFHGFGMKEISSKTINLLSSALQYKICSTNWVGNEQFWKNYINDLPKQSFYESKNNLDRFLRTLKSMKYEEERIKQFNFELNEFINLP